MPLVQTDPDSISLAAIAAWQNDGYLSVYAEAVDVYRHPVIRSFGHEIDGSWSLLGFVWFDSTNDIGQDFGINSPATVTAFRDGASTFARPES